MKIIDLQTFEELQFKTFKFPGGEINVKIEPPRIYAQLEINSLPLNRTAKIVQQIKCSDDIMELLLATDILKSFYYDRIVLELPYIPYARQDRPMVVGEALSIKVFANLINAQNYYKVIVLDPHSHVSSALFNNVVALDNIAFVTKSFEYLNTLWTNRNYTLISPDAGALKKTEKCFEHLVNHNLIEDIATVIGAKYRDVKTGKITKTTINVTEIPSENICVIIDDICDGGRTFIELAKVLKEHGASKVILIVTHGIFSAGLKPLAEYIDMVISSDSYRTVQEEEYEGIIDYACIPVVNKILI